MSMALVMSQMPDVWRKVLAEHVPDATSHCRECHNGGGQASWPCQTYRIAQEAKWVAEGNLPGTGPHGPGPSAAPHRSPSERRGEPSRAPGPDPWASSRPFAPGPPNVARPLDAPQGGYSAPTSPPPRNHGPVNGHHPHGQPSTGSLPATGAWPSPTSGSYPMPAVPPGSMGPSTGSYPTTAAHSGGFRPLAGDPLGTPYPEPAMSGGRPGGEQPYGSTFDAPYGASFGVDDRPHAARY